MRSLNYGGFFFILDTLRIDTRCFAQRIAKRHPITVENRLPNWKICCFRENCPPMYFLLLINVDDKVMTTVLSLFQA
jgi:hypothetical protein